MSFTNKLAGHTKQKDCVHRLLLLLPLLLLLDSDCILDSPESRSNSAHVNQRRPTIPSPVDTTKASYLLAGAPGQTMISHRQPHAFHAITMAQAAQNVRCVLHLSWMERNGTRPQNDGTAHSQLYMAWHGMRNLIISCALSIMLPILS